ncbi:MAG: serpin family protein [Sphingomonas bacterium]|nr:serpin family protein [Sphingomonas bacterium]
MLKITAMLLTIGLAALGVPAVAQQVDEAPVPAAAAAQPPLSKESTAAVRGINAFALDLYKTNSEPAANLFLSPASVSTAIGLAYRGARGRTADEIRATLHYPAGPRDYGPGNGEVLRALQLRTGARVVNIANALWVQQGMTFAPDYLADMRSAYGAGLNQIDFLADPDAARLRINSWVEEQTGNRIRGLLQQPDVSQLTRAVLVNTIYMKAPWASPFAATATRDQPFTLLDGGHVFTPLMTQRSWFRTIERGGVQAIALPWQGGELEMIVLLPKSAGKLPRIEHALDSARLDAWVSDLNAARGVDTILTLPRFHLTWRADLVPALKSMGMATALGDDANFGAMKPFNPNSPNIDDHGLQISHVIHQTFLDVDENGAEAAAATAVSMDVIVSGMRHAPPPPPPVIFRADRPFLFLIRDTRSGTILFMGRFVAPSASGANRP